MQRLMTTGEAPEIVIENVEGDLQIRGWNRPELFLRCDDDSAEVVQGESGVRLTVRDDAMLQLPVDATLRIRHIAGDAQISSILGTVTIEYVEGDLSVRDCGALSVQKVSGDLTARAIRGDMRCANVESDLRVAGIHGALFAENVGNDVDLSDVRGSVYLTAGDDVSARLLLLAGATYEINAGNDITLRMQVEPSARMMLTARGDIQFRKLNVPQTRTQGSVQITLGAGEAALTLVAGNDMSLVGLSLEEMGDLTLEMGADLGNRAAELAQQIATQIEAQVGSVARQLDEKLSSFSNGEELASRIQEKIQGALRRAEERVSEAMRNAETRTRDAEKRAADAERRRERFGHGFPGSGWPQPPTPPPPPRPPRAKAPVSEEERLLILRMVSEGKISVEQAEKLLNALNSPGTD